MAALFYSAIKPISVLAQQCCDGSGLRMCEDQNQRDNQCVNTQGLDQRQTDQHGNGDFTGRFGISGNTLNGRLQTNPLTNTTAESGNGDSKTSSSCTRDKEL